MAGTPGPATPAGTPAPHSPVGAPVERAENAAERDFLRSRRRALPEV
ncbi:hypothetical protein ACFTXM_37170 [Streptomyces sp. NPDC056930]